MLVLTRKLNEAIVVDDQTVIRVIGISQGRVRLGVEAPNHISVDREEIHKQKGKIHDNRSRRTIARQREQSSMNQTLLFHG